MSVSSVPTTANLTLLEDHQLLSLCRGRDERCTEAASLLVSRLNGFLVAMASGVSPLQSDDLADVLQETWSRAFQSSESVFKSAPEFRAWLKVVIRSRVLDLLRRPKAEPISDHVEVGKLPPVCNPTAEALALCLAELDHARPDFAGVVRGILEGKSGNELSDEMQISPNTVYSRFDRSKQMLKECIERRLA